MRSGVAFAGLAVATAVLSGAAVAVASGGTLATFSDTATGTAVRVGAASVVLDREQEDLLELEFALTPGLASTVTLAARYQGTVPADLQLRLSPGAQSPVCDAGVAPSAARARLDAPLTLAVGGREPSYSYCELLGGAPIVLATGVEPGAEVTVDLRLDLRAAPAFLDGLRQVDDAVLAAVGPGGFGHEVRGTLAMTVDHPAGGPAGPPPPPGATRSVVVAPTSATAPAGAEGAPAATVRYAPEERFELPRECAEAGMRAEDFRAHVVLADGVTSWDAGALGAGAGPFVVIGTDAGDTITGSDGADCIAGGAGADILTGGDGDDVLAGGDGADELRGGPGADRLHGGPGGATCDAQGDSVPARDCTAPPASAERAPAPSSTPPAPSSTPPAPSSTPPAPSSSPPAPTGAPAAGGAETAPSSTPTRTPQGGPTATTSAGPADPPDGTGTAAGAGGPDPS